MKNMLVELTPPILRKQYQRVRRSIAGVPTPRREFLLPEIEPARLINAQRALLKMPSSLVNDRGPLALPSHEAFILAGICQTLLPAQIFEFGTYTGLSSLVMAANSPPSARITTLDIDPATFATHEHGLGVGGITAFDLGAFYRKSEFAGMVDQLIGDSSSMDFGRFEGKVDLTFVDADHSYEFVKKDSANAFRMRSPSGWIVWDDYVWAESHPECAGVARVLHELAAKEAGKFFQIKGSRLAVYVP